MRTLSLVDCIKFEFPGQVLRNALCFGDADNDGINEFVIGSVDGNVSVYRSDKCICSAVDVGEVSCVVIGDLLNIERNVLIVISTDGWCHVFDIDKEMQLQQSSEKPSTKTTPSTTPGHTEYSSIHTATTTEEHEQQPQYLPPEYVVTPFHSQRIPPNIKTVHLGDVNNDGLIEMIVGLSDRVLRTYQWKVETNEQTISVISPLRAYYENPIYGGHLVALNKWEFPSQICSTSLYQKDDSNLSVIVSHPGGSVTEISETLTEKLTAEEQALLEMSTPATSNLPGPRERSMSGYSTTTLSSAAASSSGATIVPSNRGRFLVREDSKSSNAERDNSSRIIIIHYDLCPIDEIRTKSNSFMTSEIIGNVKSMEKSDEAKDCYAVATLDGTVMIARKDAVLWKKDMQQQIFALSQINGKLLMSGWSGETYLIDSDEIKAFNFDEPVLTFVAGKYGVNYDFYGTESNLINQFSVAYVSFNDKVYIYPIEESIVNNNKSSLL